MKMMFDGREIETGGGGLTQEEADARYLQLSGGTLTGHLSVPDAAEASHAVNKGQLDAGLSGIDRGVTSFKGRTGAVTPQSGDYTAAQVGAYTQAQCISANTRTALGLGSAATPDQALAALKTSLNAFPAASKVAAIETGTASASASTFSITTTNTPVCILFMCNEANKLHTYTDVPAVGIAGQSYGVLMDYGYDTYKTSMMELTVSVSGKTWKISTKSGASLSKKFTYFALTKK